MNSAQLIKKQQLSLSQSDDFLCLDFTVDLDIAIDAEGMNPILLFVNHYDLIH